MVCEKYSTVHGKHMVTNIRERNGLSCDVPKNQSESLNAKLRRKTNYRANKLQVFYVLLKMYIILKKKGTDRHLLVKVTLRCLIFFRDLLPY